MRKVAKSSPYLFELFLAKLSSWWPSTQSPPESEIVEEWGATDSLPLPSANASKFGDAEKILIDSARNDSTVEWGPSSNSFLQ